MQKHNFNIIKHSPEAYRAETAENTVISLYKDSFVELKDLFLAAVVNDFNISKVRNSYIHPLSPAAIN